MGVSAMSESTAIESTPAATPEPTTEPAGDPSVAVSEVTGAKAHEHEWVLKWQHPKMQRTVRDCSDPDCGARLFGDKGQQTLGKVTDHAPWVKAEHKAAYDKSLQVQAAKKN
jgi:hypothetical protein